MSKPKRRQIVQFTPELEKQFNWITIPGTNVNSNTTVGETARKTGVQALNFLVQEAARKDAEIESRSDRKTVKRLTTVGERLRGDNGYSSYMSAGTPVSGWDPALGTIFDWTVGAKGIDALGKTALWNYAKYGSSNLFRGLARNYFINNAFKLELRKPILFGFGTELTPNNLFRTKVYKGGEITDPYSNFVTTDPRYAANYGKVTPYLFESKSISRTTEPMMGYKDPVNMDMFIYNNTKHNPGTTAIMGHDAVTGEFTPSRGIEILNLNPKNLYPIETSEPSTSLKFFERKPSKNNIVGASLDYSMKDSKGIDFIKQFFALLKINGKEYTLEGLKDAKNVLQGLPEYIQLYLNLNTVERAVRAMRKNGYSEREILQYVDKVNEEMNKVKVGIYSDLEYNAAGALDFGGFYNSDTNFISINKDALLTKSAFTPNYIMKHEGRHLIDYNTSMTDDVINILEKAYDKDFLEIPKHEDAGSLKNYQHMDRERVTTNRDAREVLLSNLEKRPGEFLNLIKFAQTSFGKNKDMVDFLNELILYAEPEDIINAVENSNGYGKRYINYLKKNNKLTTTKIEQLRLAMIHVPSYVFPIVGGYTLYNLFNLPLQQLQYLKQGGKMNILLFLKNGSGIHIKKKNRGKFTLYCGGKVTDECIRKAKASGNPTLVKRATFADNARHFKHKDGGILFAQEGTTFGLKVNNFLSSDLGKSVISGIGQLYNGINSNNLLSKAQSEFNTSLEYKKKFMLDSYLNSPNLSLRALNNLEQKKLENPEQNFSKLDYQLELKKLQSEVASQVIPRIDYELTQEKNLFNENISAIKGENTNSLISGIFNIGKTALLNYQNKKLSSN